MSEELPGSARAKVAMGLIVVVLVVEAVAAVFGFSELSLLRDAMAGEYISIDRANTVAARGAAIGGLYSVAFLAAAVGFLVSFYRAHRNLQSLDVDDDTEYSPGWAVGSFLVPILNFFRPYQVAREIWKASDPSVAADAGWRSLDTPALLKWWWGLFLTTTLLAQIAIRATLMGGGLFGFRPDLPMLIAGTCASIASNVLSIGAGVLAIQLIREVHARQQAKAAAISREPPGAGRGSPSAGAGAAT